MRGTTRVGSGGVCQRKCRKPKLRAFTSLPRNSLCTDHLLSNPNSLAPQPSIIDRLHEVAAMMKQVLPQSMVGEKLLCLSG